MKVAFLNLGRVHSLSRTAFIAYVVDVFVSASISYDSPFSEIIFLPYTHLELVTLIYCHQSVIICLMHT